MSICISLSLSLTSYIADCIIAVWRWRDYLSIIISKFETSSHTIPCGPGQPRVSIEPVLSTVIFGRKVDASHEFMQVYSVAKYTNDTLELLCIYVDMHHIHLVL